MMDFAAYPVTDDEWVEHIWAAMITELEGKGFTPRCVRRIGFPVFVPSDTPIPTPQYDVIGVVVVYIFKKGETAFTQIFTSRVLDENDDPISPAVIAASMVARGLEARSKAEEQSSILRRAVN